MDEIESLAEELEEEIYKNQSLNVMSSLNSKDVASLTTSKDTIRDFLYEELSNYQSDSGSDISIDVKDRVVACVMSNLWGYGIIDSLIKDKEISDIKIYDYDHIRIKSRGKRKDARISFTSKEAHKKFVMRLLERNRINLGTANASQTFTDDTQDFFSLRITVLSELLIDSKIPCIAIRKIPKNKYKLEDLRNMGMFKNFGKPGTDKQLENFCKEMVGSKGILFTGKGASGKTTLMNAMLAEVPYDESIMLCQENTELFDNQHPDIMSAHVVNSNADSKISYTLGDLTRASLLMDLDRVIVGEVKEGSEAEGLSKASMTGHKCWTSVHGESCYLGIDKMADYISRATSYSMEESKRQLQGFEYVIHLKDFNVDEIVHIEGVNKDGTLRLKKVYTKKGFVE